MAGGFVGARKRFGYGKKIAGAGSRSGDRSEPADARHSATPSPRQTCTGRSSRLCCARGHVHWYWVHAGIGLVQADIVGFYLVLVRNNAAATRNNTAPYTMSWKSRAVGLRVSYHPPARSYQPGSLNPTIRGPRGSVGVSSHRTLCDYIGSRRQSIARRMEPRTPLLIISEPSTEGKTYSRILVLDVRYTRKSTPGRRTRPPCPIGRPRSPPCSWAGHPSLQPSLGPSSISSA